MNFRIGAAVDFYDMLHGFRSGRGTGTPSLESNLLHQITIIREEVLCEVFLDLRKAYRSLERERRMEIPVGYSIRPRTERLLHLDWDHLQMVAQTGQYNGSPFRG